MKETILIFNSSYPLVRCGIGDYTAKLADSIGRYTPHQVIVVTSKTKLIKSIKNNHLMVLPIIKTWTVRDFLKVILGLLKFRPERVILEYPAVMPTGGYNLTYWLPILSKIFFRQAKVILILHEFSNTVEENKGRLKKVFPFVDEIVIFNDADHNSLMKFMPSVKNKIRKSFIGPSFDSKKLPTDLSVFRNRLGVSQSAKLITFFGFLNGEEKGFETLLGAFEQLIKRTTDIKLLVVGAKLSDQPYHQKLLKLIRKKKLSKNIIWTGFVGEREALIFLSLSDVVVLPFKYGAVQNKTTLITALSLGLPIITTKVNGVTPSYFKDKENTILVSPSNKNQLAEAIKSVLENETLAKKLRENALKLSKQFNWKNAASDLTRSKEKLKIAVDLRPLQSSTRQRGIGYFTLNLFSKVFEKAKDEQFIAYTTLTGKLPKKLGLRKKDMRFGIPTLFRPRRGIRRFDPILAPFWHTTLAFSRPQILHLTSIFEVYYLSFPKNIKKIITLHDIIPILFPENFFENEKAKQWYLKRLSWVKKADKIITISEVSKKDLIKKLKIPTQKIEVVYPAIDSYFRPVPAKEARKILAGYKIKDPYLLSVSAFSFHKNMSRVFEAFKKYLEKSRDKSLKLVVVCKLIKKEEKGWQEEINKLGLGGKVILTNFVADEAMPAIYSGSEALVFPSLYEGFGLPILESFACETPVITSRVSSIPEVAGKAALYVDPYSVDEIAQGIKKIITDQKLRTKLTREGFKQVKKFSWDKSAQQVLDIYHQVLAE